MENQEGCATCHREWNLLNTSWQKSLALSLEDVNTSGPLKRGDIEDFVTSCIKKVGFDLFRNSLTMIPNNTKVFSLVLFRWNW